MKMTTNSTQALASSSKKNDALKSVIAAIVVQLCCGIAYIWSVFQNGIAESLFEGNHSLASLTFSIQLVVLTCGSVLGGKLMSGKLPIRYIIMTGCLIMSIGFLLASFTTAEFPAFIWIAYGGLGGFGMGMTYSTSIAVAQEWYPHKKGLVTGIIVAALGFSGVIFAPIAEVIIEKFGGVGVGEMAAYRVIAVVFFLAGFVFMALIKRAPKAEPTATATAAVKESLTVKQVLRLPQFYMLVVSFCLACMGGLMMIGFAKPIALGKGLGAAATLGVLFMSIFNSTGRLVWGAVSDKLGRLTTISLILLGSVIMSLLVNYTQGYWVLVAICLIGFFYGGILSNFPAITADLFGGKYIALIYGIVLLGFGVGAVVASAVAGHYKNLAANDISLMTPAFLIAAACGAVSMLLIVIIFKTRKSIR